MKFKSHIFAEVRLFSTDQGGRRIPTPAEFFGCPLGYAGEYFDMRLDLSDIGSLAPGSTAQAPIIFLYPGLIVPRLNVGSKFTLWEGKIIGNGAVLEILDPSEK